MNRQGRARFLEARSHHHQGRGRRGRRMVSKPGGDTAIVGLVIVCGFILRCAALPGLACRQKELDDVEHAIGGPIRPGQLSHCLAPSRLRSGGSNSASSRSDELPSVDLVDLARILVREPPIALHLEHRPLCRSFWSNSAQSSQTILRLPSTISSGVPLGKMDQPVADFIRPDHGFGFWREVINGSWR